MTKQTNSKPVFKFNIGVVSGAVWANERAGFTSYDASFKRGYIKETTADGKDIWGDTQSFGRDDLLALAKCADVCHSWILREQQKKEAQ